VQAGVALPRSADEVEAVVRTCREMDVTMRGGGTSVAENVCGEGLIVGTFRYMLRPGFGFEASHREVSQAVGERRALPAARSVDPATIIPPTGSAAGPRSSRGRIAERSTWRR
jgi:hypothetical protein